MSDLIPSPVLLAILQHKINNVTDEQVNSAVNKYLTDNPVQAYDDSEIKSEIGELKGDLANSKKAIAELNDKKITKFYASNLGKINLSDSDKGKIQNMMLYGKSSQDGSPTSENPVEIKSVVNPKLRIVGGTKSALLTEAQYNTLTTLKSYLDNRFDIYYVPKNNQGFEYCVVIILNSNSFNVVSEIGKIETYEQSEYWVNIFREIGTLLCSSTVDPKETIGYGIEPQTASLPYTLNAIPVTDGGNVTIDDQKYIADYVDFDKKQFVRMVDGSKLETTVSIIDNTDLLLETPTITDLTDEEVQAFKELTTYYHTTNVIVTSDQLDGYAKFNYPLSMANGWNLIKEQLGDTREYIYDMELQSAEAYVNSEYAVTLTELGV